MVRADGSITRPGLAALCGLSRRHGCATRAGNSDEVGLLREAGESRSTGGRRATPIGFPDDVGVVLADELGATHASIRLAKLAAAPWVRRIALTFPRPGKRHLLSRTARRARPYKSSVCLSEPSGPVPSGYRPNSTPTRAKSPGPQPPAGTTYRSRPVENWLPVPVVIDNEVNAMAIGDYDAKWRHDNLHDLLFVKHRTESGADHRGAICRGPRHRGRDRPQLRVRGRGADHVLVRQLELPPGCRQRGRPRAPMQQRGYEVAVAADVSALVRQGDVVAMNLMREAGRALAEVLSPLVNFFNPGAIVAGGSLGALEIPLLAALREVIMRTRCSRPATFA